MSDSGGELSDLSDLSGRSRAPAGRPPPPPGARPPAPGSYAGPPPPKKSGSRRSGCVVGLIVLAVLVVGVAGCVVLFARAVSAPIDAGNEFIALLDEGRIEEAYASIDESCRTYDFEEFEDELSGMDITGYRLNSSSVSSQSGGPSTATVEGTIERSGRSDPIVIELLERDDEWRVCRAVIG